MQPLLPDSAELKLLRSAQLRVNRRTDALDEVRPKEGRPDDLIAEEIGKVSTLQEEIAEMTREMLERN